MKTCSIRDCDKEHKGKGYCSIHYDRWRIHGDPMYIPTVERHGMRDTATYNTWANVKQRCLNKQCKDYPNYGGRGITMCDEWVNSFSTFLNDMGEKPSDEHSIDRKDNSKGYSLENCRWATRKEQNNNQRWHIDWKTDDRFVSKRGFKQGDRYIVNVYSKLYMKMVYVGMFVDIDEARQASRMVEEQVNNL